MSVTQKLAKLPYVVMEWQRLFSPVDIDSSSNRKIATSIMCDYLLYDCPDYTWESTKYWKRQEFIIRLDDIDFNKPNICVVYQMQCGTLLFVCAQTSKLDNRKPYTFSGPAVPGVAIEFKHWTKLE